MGVKFEVTDGRRTLRTQLARWRKYRGVRPVAFPTPAAPHINYGRANHAIDVNSNDGGAVELVWFLDTHGCRSACRPIQGEPWHIEIGRAELLRFAKRIEKERAK